MGLILATLLVTTAPFAEGTRAVDRARLPLTSLDVRRLGPCESLSRFSIELSNSRAAARRSGDSLTNGTIVGAIVGGGYGATVIYIIGSGSEGEMHAKKAAGILLSSTAIGAGVGLLVDAIR